MVLLFLVEVLVIQEILRLVLLHHLVTIQATATSEIEDFHVIGFSTTVGFNTGAGYRTPPIVQSLNHSHLEMQRQISSSMDQVPEFGFR